MSLNATILCFFKIPNKSQVVTKFHVPKSRFHCIRKSEKCNMILYISRVFLHWQYLSDQLVSNTKEKSAGSRRKPVPRKQRRRSSFNPSSTLSLSSTAVTPVNKIMKIAYKNLITKKELGMMKKTSFLINTSRGPIVNENGDLIAIAVSGLAKDQTEGINIGMKSSAAETFLR